VNPRETALVDYYDSKPSYYSPLEAFSGLQIAAMVGVMPSTPILDLGCGSGRLGLTLPGPIDGIDVSEVRLRTAKATGCYRWLTLGSVYDVELTEQYATIFAIELFEHLAKPRSVIRKARRALTENGRLVATVPINMPNHAHLAVFDSARQAATKLGAMRYSEIEVRQNRHAVLRWDA
jgi:2-polyprenyl-3-methyl-5-hydroxy-6-metoxy-1,4-benzoquinol methylase